MTSTTVCDHCDKRIESLDRRVTVDVADHLFLPRRGEAPPERLTVHLDFHRECYIEALLPTMTAFVGAPS